MKHTNKKINSYKNIDQDKEGYLKKIQDWNRKIANEIAKKENIILTCDHWIIIDFIRNFYIKFNITPSMRILTQGIQSKLKNNTSIYLFKLFPQGPAKQASKIAGIPKPTKCL